MAAEEKIEKEAGIAECANPEFPELAAQLAEFGLTQNESRIYLALLSRGKALGGSEIARETAIHRQYVYVTLEKLIALGLVISVRHGARAIYRAAPPATLEKIARKKMGKVSDLVESLGKISTLDHEQDFEVIVGEQGIRDYQLEFVEHADEGETQYIIGGSAPEFIAILGTAYQKMILDQERKKFVTYYLGHQSEKDALGTYKKSRINFNAKLLPGIPEKMPQFTVRRNTVELYSFFNPPILYVIKSKEVAEKFRLFFLTLWETYK